MKNAEDYIIVRKDAPMLIRFEPSLKRQIVELAEREGCSAAALVRGAVRIYINDKRPMNRRCK